MNTPEPQAISAFPIKGYCADASGALTGEAVDQPGMSLRDYFAAAALTGMKAAETDYFGPAEPAEYAEDAYEIADAMMERRARK